MIEEVTEKNRLEEIINNNDIVVVKFGAEWCGPCKMMDGVLNKLSEKRTDVFIAKVNVDESDELVNEYNISNIPVILVYKNGSLSNKQIGSTSENKLLELLN